MKNRLLIYGAIFIVLIIVGALLGGASRTGDWSHRAGIEILWNIIAALVGFVVSLVLMKVIKKEANETLNIIGWILVFLNLRFIIARPEMSIYSMLLFISGAILILFSYMHRRRASEASK